VPQLVLQDALVEVETPDREGGRVREAREQPFKEVPRLAVLLDKAEDLVYFVGNDVSIIVLMVFCALLLLPLRLWNVLFVLLLDFFDSGPQLFYLLFFISQRNLNARRRGVLQEETRLWIVSERPGRMIYSRRVLDV
jgi:hypothetical protein